jgi:sugar transferase (PEP-CTERM/EpsH1 system associated)
MTVSAGLELTVDTRPMSDASPPLIAHLVSDIEPGSLDAGLALLLEHMPEQRYRHVVICLKGNASLPAHLVRKGVRVVSLHKREGKDPAYYIRLYRLLRQLRPDVLHSRNLPTMELQAIAAMAGIRARVHGEHGQDGGARNGGKRRYHTLRQAMLPFVNHFIAVSEELEGWLIQHIGVPADRVSQIYNSIDTVRFHPGRDTAAAPSGFLPADALVIGCVGAARSAGAHADASDPVLLAQAFLMLLERQPERRRTLRLIVLGAEESNTACARLLREAGAGSHVWFAEDHRDQFELPALMRAMDLFVMPSPESGSFQIALAAMASGLPLIAARAGAHPELVEDCATGKLVPPDDAIALAATLYHYCNDSGLRQRHGAAARRRAEGWFSVESMVKAYSTIYDQLLREAPAAATL